VRTGIHGPDSNRFTGNATSHLHGLHFIVINVHLHDLWFEAVLSTNEKVGVDGPAGKGGLIWVNQPDQTADGRRRGVHFSGVLNHHEDGAVGILCRPVSLCCGGKGSRQPVDVWVKLASLLVLLLGERWCPLCVLGHLK